MTEDSGEFVVSRIVVEIDTSIREFSRVELALFLAARLKARLLARFVEDSDLLRLAQLPASREVRWADASLRPLDPSHTRRALRIQAERVKQRLLREARKVRVECSFETVQGKTLRMEWNWRESDVFVAGRGPRGTRGEGGGEPRLSSCSVAVLYEGGEASRQALAAAAGIAEAVQGRLRILLPAGPEVETEVLRGAVAKWTESRGLHADIETWLGSDPARLAEAAGPVILVISRRQPFVNPAFVQAALESVELAIVVP